MKEQAVFSVVVKSKHVLADVFQWIKNAIGMNLSAYENMIEEAIEEALFKFYKKFPDVYDVKISTTQVTTGACEIIVYGKIKVKDDKRNINKRHNK